MKQLLKLNLVLYLGLIYNSSCIATYQKDTDARKILKTFAENYEPKNKINQPPDMLPKVSESIKKAIYEADTAGEKYLTLIILKLYRAHLECCNQSYELRPDSELNIVSNPILNEFLKITKQYSSTKYIEFIPSSIAYEWTVKHPYLSEYDDINREIAKIKKLKNKNPQ